MEISILYAVALIIFVGIGIIKKIEPPLTDQLDISTLHRFINKKRLISLLSVAVDLTKDNAKKDHTKHIIKWLEKLDAHSDIRDAVASHAWGYVENAPQPKSKMEWALYCCDELTGLIVAVALVKPDKRLASVTAESVMKKWNSSSFAAGVNRKQIEECDARLNLPLSEFVGLAISAMQRIHDDLGL